MTIDVVQYSHSTLDWFSGLSVCINAGVFSTRSIIADNQFDPAFLCRIIEEHRITFLVQSPAQLAMLVSCPEFEASDLSSIRHYVYGGTSCSVEMQQRMRSRLRQADCLVFSYNLTEMNSLGCLNHHYDEKPNSVGRPVRGIKVKIINEEGEALGPTEMGEVCFNNGQHWSGYYGNPEETRLMIDSQQWLHTGDLGYMDPGGFLYLVDRKKDMLKYQSIMYYPSEIETVIARMPNVAEVCVFGVWAEVNGDEAAASVVKKPGTQLLAQDVLNYVREHIEAKHKQLNAGAIIVEDLLRSPNGKTHRMATKAHFLEVTKRQKT
ncbi:4-coumarate--CoA ligase 1-like isoform X2 [Drosophila obscura]|nr:4-coumarate--CoA ligase 1-like isoform X2 [Drosophila obscura]